MTELTERLVGSVSGVPAPARRHLAMEGRAFMEYAALRATVRHALPRLPHGDGHPVLVVPGFASDDRSAQRLRSTLTALGWDSRPWGQGRNLGPSESAVAGLVGLVESARAETGQSVSLVGYSLGGFVAREVARAVPDAVRSVITLGAPFRFRQGDMSSILKIMQRVSGLLPPMPLPADMSEPPREEERPPLDVPSTAIYSPTDGIVRPQLCIDGPGPLRENVAVRSSHCGLTFNPAAVFVVADRLAQPVGQWTPFRAPRGTGAFFPDPAVWSPPSH